MLRADCRSGRALTVPGKIDGKGRLGGQESRVIGRKNWFPRMGILPEGFDGEECHKEAQGRRVMGETEVSHDCNTPGTRIGRGCHPIKPGVPFPKGMGRGNTLGG